MEPFVLLLSERLPRRRGTPTHSVEGMTCRTVTAAAIKFNDGLVE